MDLCSDKHDEVCYDSRICPVCNMRDDLEDTIEDFEDVVKNMQQKIDDLESQL